MPKKLSQRDQTREPRPENASVLIRQFSEARRSSSGFSLLAMSHQRNLPSSARPSTSQRNAPPKASSSSLPPPNPPKQRRRMKKERSTTRAGSHESGKPQNKSQVDGVAASSNNRKNQTSMKNIWLYHFTNILGNKAKALATLKPRATPPDFDTCKAFICALGRWGIGTYSWSYLSTKINADCVLDMLFDHCRIKNMDETYRQPIDIAIEKLFQEVKGGDLTYIEGLPSITCFTTCHFCGLCIFNDADAPAHFEACYTDAIAKMFLKITENNSAPMGSESLSHRVRRKEFVVINTFCPLCLFDTTLPWDQRMITQPRLLPMAQHIVSHGKENGEFRMDKRLYCGFFPWEKSEGDPDANWFTVPDMFTHLHNDHGYKLLACVDPFHYLCSKREYRKYITEKRDLRAGGVKNTILYASDIQRIRQHLGHDAEEFGTICLMDYCRTAEEKAIDIAAIDRIYGEQDPDGDLQEVAI